ncbi:unnamed protein product [Gordionus sp. m RMFG-2023]
MINSQNWIHSANLYLTIYIEPTFSRYTPHNYEYKIQYQHIHDIFWLEPNVVFKRERRTDNLRDGHCGLNSEGKIDHELA